MSENSRRAWAVLIPAIPEHLTVTTHLLPEAAIACIRSIAALGPRRLLVFPPRRTEDAVYYGRIDNDKFTLHPYLPIRDGGYLMTIRGEIVLAATGSAVRVSFRARSWLWVLLFVCVMEFLALQIRNASDLVWGLVAFWIGYHALGCFLYWYQEGRARRNLVAALAGSIRSSHKSDPSDPQKRQQTV
jgi:hypothetical protein